MIFTLGYTGLRVADLVRWAEAWEVMVVDTRLVPWSKDAEWRMPALIDRLGGRYLWLKDFGNLRYRDPNPDAIDLVNPERGVRIAARLLRSGSILLFCLEAKSEQCHRSEVASLIHDATGAPIHHLSAADLSSQRRLEL